MLRNSLWLRHGRPNIVVSPLMAELFSGVLPHVVSSTSDQATTPQAVETLFARALAPCPIYRVSAAVVPAPPVGETELKEELSKGTAAQFRTTYGKQRFDHDDDGEGDDKDESHPGPATTAPRPLLDPLAYATTKVRAAWTEALAPRPKWQRRVWKRVASRSYLLSHGRMSRLVDVVARVDGEMAAMLIWQWWRVHHAKRGLWPRETELLQSPLAYRGIAVCVNHAPALLRPWMDLIRVGTTVSQQCRDVWTATSALDEVLPFEAWVVAAAVVDDCTRQRGANHFKRLSFNRRKHNRMRMVNVLKSLRDSRTRPGVASEVAAIAKRVQAALSMVAPRAVGLADDLVAALLPLHLSSTATTPPAAPPGIVSDVWRSLWNRYFNASRLRAQQESQAAASSALSQDKKAIRVELDRTLATASTGAGTRDVKNVRREVVSKLAAEDRERTEILQQARKLSATSPGVRLRAACQHGLPPAGYAFLIHVIALEAMTSPAASDKTELLELATEIMKEYIKSQFNRHRGAEYMAQFGDAEIEPNAPFKPHFALLMPYLQIAASAGDLRIVETIINDVLPCRPPATPAYAALLGVALRRRSLRLVENALHCPSLGRSDTTRGVLMGLQLTAKVEAEVIPEKARKTNVITSRLLLSLNDAALAVTKPVDMVELAPQVLSILKLDAADAALRSPLQQHFTALTAAEFHELPLPAEDDALPHPLIAFAEMVAMHKDPHSAATFVIFLGRMLTNAMDQPPMRRYSLGAARRQELTTDVGVCIRVCEELIAATLDRYFDPWRASPELVPFAVVAAMGAIVRRGTNPTLICRLLGWTPEERQFPWLLPRRFSRDVIRSFCVGIRRGIAESDDVDLARLHSAFLEGVLQRKDVKQLTRYVPELCDLLRLHPHFTGYEFDVRDASAHRFLVQNYQSVSERSWQLSTAEAVVLPSLHEGMDASVSGRTRSQLVSNEGLWAEGSVMRRMARELHDVQSRPGQGLHAAGYDLFALGATHAHRLALAGALARPLAVRGALTDGVRVVTADASHFSRHVEGDTRK